MEFIKKYLIAFFLGAALTLSFAPYEYTVIAPISMGLFVFLLYRLAVLHKVKKPSWLAFKLGYCFGFGHFLTGLYWIAHPMLVDRTFIWLLPAAITIIPALSALFPAIWALTLFKVNHYTQSRGRFFLIPIASSLIWIGTEYLRSYLILPFPWLLLGYCTSGSLTLMQFAAIAGVPGLSFIISLSATALGLILLMIIRHNKEKDNLNFAFSAHNIVILIPYILSPLAIALSGYLSLSEGIAVVSHDQADMKKISMYLVQPNIQQHPRDAQAKNSAFHHVVGLIPKHLREDNQLSNQTEQGYALIILPESSYPFLVSAQQKIMEPISAIGLKKDVFVITGADYYDEDQNFFNSLFLVDHQGTILSRYDKRILAPFGEYVPWANILNLIFPHALTNSWGFQKGKDTIEPMQIPLKYEYPNDIDGNNINFLPYICYEIAFDQLQIPTTIRKNTTFIINITNDVWLGNTSGPYQHLAMARFRAIETNLPVIRVANTGISALIDPNGRVTAQSVLNEATVLKRSQ